VPPESALDHLDGALRRLRDRPGAPRWVGRDLQHVTLAFFGEVPEGTVPALTAAVGAALAVDALHLRLSGGGTFPARGDPRVLWIGVDGDVERLAGLAEAAADAGRSVGVPIERRAYRPHVTVGRWPHSAHGDRRIATRLANYAGPHFTAGEVVLMRSHHGSAPRYETVAAWRGAPGGTVGTRHPTPR
jgi:RNA 2',3'-cyclic 3'-phosphodiesterase